MNGQFAHVPKEMLDDGQPLRAGDAFEVDLATGRARRIDMDNLSPEEREFIENAKAEARIAECAATTGHTPCDPDGWVSHCRDCGTYMERLPSDLTFGDMPTPPIPGGDPVAYFNELLEEAGFGKIESSWAIMKFVEEITAAQLEQLRLADRRLRAHYASVDTARSQVSRLANLFGLRVTDGRKRTRTNGSAEPAPRVQTDGEATDGGDQGNPARTGYTLSAMVRGREHRFQSSTSGGTVDLFAAFLRENLVEDQTIAINLRFDG